MGGNSPRTLEASWTLRPKAISLPLSRWIVISDRGGAPGIRSPRRRLFGCGCSKGELGRDRLLTLLHPRDHRLRGGGDLELEHGSDGLLVALADGLRRGGRGPLTDVVAHHRGQAVDGVGGRGQVVVHRVGLAAAHDAEDVGERRQREALGLVVGLGELAPDVEQGGTDVLLVEAERGDLVGVAVAREDADGVAEDVALQRGEGDVVVLGVVEVGLDLGDRLHDLAADALRDRVEEGGVGLLVAVLVDGVVRGLPAGPAQGLQEDALGAAVGGQRGDRVGEGGGQQGDERRHEGRGVVDLGVHIGKSLPGTLLCVPFSVCGCHPRGFFLTSSHLFMEFFKLL